MFANDRNPQFGSAALAMILVCPMTRVAEMAQAHKPRRMLSLVGGDDAVQRPPSIRPQDHLTLRFNDIAEPLEGHVLPSIEHVARALGFAAGGDGPILVHCYAGVSRSTAMAYAIACAREPGRCERELALTLRRLSPTATPNRLIVRLADEALGREGRMVEAIADIGRGRDAFEGEPFTLSPLAAP